MRMNLSSLRSFALILALLLTLLAANRRAEQAGDFLEYGVMAIALAAHGTPDIRASDVQEAIRLEPNLASVYQQLAAGMRAKQEIPVWGFNRGRNGDYFAIHFFAYPALAAVPMRLLALAGLPPFKSFQIVNLGFLFILGLCLFRLFGSSARAFAGLALFMLCGGALYWNWCSPETMSAAALLSGLILFVTGAPRLGGLLAGLAATQNPPIVAFFGFAPLMRIALQHQAGERWLDSVRAALRAPYLQGMLVVALLTALPVMFNLWQFGVPSLIAKYSTTNALISWSRLHSFFFDLNQGMLIGVPVLMAALLVWGWDRQRLRSGAMLALAAAFAVVLAVPALAAQNWNSGANGMMRYAFWSAMPLLFAFLLRLRALPRWPLAVLLVVALGQAACMSAASSYSYLELSPLARRVLDYAPSFYNPDPEIFYERSVHVDGMPEDTSAKVIRYQSGGTTTKAMYDVRTGAVNAELCGEGLQLAPGNNVVDVAQQWRYINGPVLCEGVHARGRVDDYEAAQFKGGAVGLETGWSGVEFGGGPWNGVWTDGARSRLTIRLAPGRNPASLVIKGHYGERNERTRVSVNGVDLGWQRLNRMPTLQLPASARARGASLAIEFENEAPTAPSGTQDRRQLAFFMERISLQ